MDEKEIEEIEKILDNKRNENILKLNNNQVKIEKEEALDNLYLGSAKKREILKKLKNYRFVENLNEIHYGSYLRTINLKNPQCIKLNNGGIIIDILFENNPIILLKNNLNFIFQINFNESLIFQKISNQEQIILQITDYINK